MIFKISDLDIRPIRSMLVPAGTVAAANKFSVSLCDGNRGGDWCEVNIEVLVDNVRFKHIERYIGGESLSITKPRKGLVSISRA